MEGIKDLKLDHLLGKEVGTATIIKELARGGSAIVFIAYQRTLKRQIALKILPKSLITPETAERFQMEAESAAILSHPNIIPIYEVGETDEFLFFAMQLIQGRSLAYHIEAAQKHVLPTRRILPVETTISIISKVLEALDYAHSQEIIHRDIKPSNVLIESHSKRPILLDFGLAKVSRGLDSESSMIQGTPVYIPPEQIRNEPGDGRSDIYASGVMLFEMLVSNLPLPKVPSMELMLLKLQKKDHLFQKKPSEMNRMVYPEMDDIVFKAISFDPENRFATCREFLDQLQEYKARHIPTKR